MYLIKKRFIEVLKNNPDLRRWFEDKPYFSPYSDTTHFMGALANNNILRYEEVLTMESVLAHLQAALMSLHSQPKSPIVLREGFLESNAFEINGYAVIYIPEDRQQEKYLLEDYISTEGEEVVFEIVRPLNTKYFAKNIFLVTWQGVRQ